MFKLIRQETSPLPIRIAMPSPVTLKRVASWSSYILAAWFSALGIFFLLFVSLFLFIRLWVGETRGGGGE